MNLKMKDDVEQILEFLQNHESEKMRDLYTAYASKIRNVMASRILIQVSKLYSTIKFIKGRVVTLVLESRSIRSPLGSMAPMCMAGIVYTLPGDSKDAYYGF